MERGKEGGICDFQKCGNPDVDWAVGSWVRSGLRLWEVWWLVLGDLAAAASMSIAATQDTAEEVHTHSPLWCCINTLCHCPCMCYLLNVPAGPPTTEFTEPDTSYRSQTGAAEDEAFIPATDEAKVLFIGRHQVVGSSKEFDLPDSAFRFEITGPAKAVYVEMSGRLLAHRDKLTQCTKNVYGSSPGMMKSFIDDQPVKRMVIAEPDEGGAKQYCVAEDVPAGPHVITVSKCSEFWYGVVALHGIVVPRDCSVKAPPPRKLIEIIGDSNSTLPGNLGPNSYDEGAMRKNMMKYTDTNLSWGAKVAQAFDADDVLIGCSGLGFMANAEPLPHGPMLDIYTRICQNEEATYSGDMPSVDLCIIYLGMNDWVMGGMAGKDSEAIAGYKKLIDLVRSKRGPSVPILCLYPDAYTVGGAPGLKRWSRMAQKGFHVNVKRWVTSAVALAGGEQAKIYGRQVRT